MRALVVTNMYPSPARPALGSFVRDQVKALRRIDGLDVQLHAFAPGGPRSYARAARDLHRRYATEEPFDVVHAHFGLTAWPALAVRARQRVVTLHGNDLYHPRSRPITTAVLGRMDLVATPTERFAAEVPGAGTRHSVAILPCGIDVERFRPLDRVRVKPPLEVTPDARCSRPDRWRGCSSPGCRGCGSACRVLADVGRIAAELDSTIGPERSLAGAPRDPAADRCLEDAPGGGPSSERATEGTGACPDEHPSCRRR